VRRLMALARAPVVQIHSAALSVELYRRGV
jgi:hypothetical protein